MYYKEMGELLFDDETFSRLILDDETSTHYLISNYGRVWSENKMKFISTHIDSTNGRRRFAVFVNGIQHTMYLARAIALAFLGPSYGREADHIDGDYTNDVLDNIQWLEPRKNKQKYCSEQSGYNVYNEETIHIVCRLMEEGFDIKYINQKTGVSMSMIRSIKNGISWSNISCKYSIENMTNTKPQQLPIEVIEFIKEKIIENVSNKEIEKLVYEKFNINGIYNSISNHKRRLKEKGII